MYKRQLQYRAAAWAGILTQFCWGALEILLFRAFYRAGASAFPMEFSQLSSYIWLSEAFLSMLATYFFENELLDLSLIHIYAPSRREEWTQYNHSRGSNHFPRAASPGCRGGAGSCRPAPWG